MHWEHLQGAFQRDWNHGTPAFSADVSGAFLNGFKPSSDLPPSGKISTEMPALFDDASGLRHGLQSCRGFLPRDGEMAGAL
jgi:hypothetical protein